MIIVPLPPSFGFNVYYQYCICHSYIAHNDVRKGSIGIFRISFASFNNYPIQTVLKCIFHKVDLNKQWTCRGSYSHIRKLCITRKCSCRFIIFLIIVLVQFIVITKGAERVAEVTARFTLDAMPGKQMAIDADLSSGIITEQEAMQRRKGVQRNRIFMEQWMVQQNL